MKTHNLNVATEDASKRLDSYLSEKIDQLSRSYAQKLIDSGDIKVSGKPVKSNYKVKENDSIEVTIPQPKELDIVADENIKLDIIYEDNDVIVINKPQGMVVHPAAGNYAGTLVNALMAHCKGNLSEINGVIRPGIVHRIDKDTTGVLVIAKNNNAHLSLAKQIKDHTVTRRYVAIVHGNISEASGTINAPIGRHPVDRKKMAVVGKGTSRHAVTHFTVLERFGEYTLIEAKLETGRTHQIRVHMAYIKHPVLGDPVYGPKKQKFNLAGQALHAKVLGFIHPTKNEYMEFEAPLPEYFERLIKILRSN